MRRQTSLAIAGVAGFALVGTAARAGSRNDCFYNGVARDDRVEAPKDFTGEYTCKDSDTGKIVLREHHLNGQPNGDYSKYDFKTGQVEETGHYRDGKLDGQVRRYRNGVIYLELSYVAGKHQGIQRDFTDGKLSRVLLVGPDGRPDTSYQLNKQGQLTSLSCGTRAIGEKDADWCGFRGKQSTVSIYDAQGRVRATQQYLAGKQHGVSKKLNPATGVVVEESRWQNGKHLPEGEQFFDKQGAPLAKTDCDQKRTTCTETVYFEGGKQVRTVTVRAGNRTMKRTEYYQNGKPQEETLALAETGGSAATRYRITSYYDNGQVARRGTFVGELGWADELDYLPDGVIESYGEDGQLRARETYAHGRLQGRAERFGVRDGKKVREDAEYDKDAIVRQKLFVDERLVEQSEFFPDGSTKSHQTYPSGGAKTKI